MIPLIVDEQAQARIRQIIEYAEKHKVPREVYERKVAANEAIDNVKDHSLILPLGFTALYCIEEQEAGWFKHLIVHLALPKCLPSQGTVMILMKLFGFERGLMTADLVTILDHHVHVLETYSPKRKGH